METIRYQTDQWLDPITNKLTYVSKTPSLLECAHLCNHDNRGPQDPPCSGFEYNSANSNVRLQPTAPNWCLCLVCERSSP